MPTAIVDKIGEDKVDDPLHSPEYKCSSLNSNLQKPTKFVLIMRCSKYEFALNIKCKHNGLSGHHNHLFELIGFLN